MAAFCRCLALAWLTFSSTGLLPISRAAEPEAAQARPELLTVTGTVLMPDGSPAAGAIVTSRSQADSHWASVVADAAGKFQLNDMFGNGMQLHATTKDGGHQSSYWLAAIATRNALTTPVELTLEPAQSQRVTVVADGKPVEGARVMAGGIDFQFEAVTGKNGVAELRFPAGKELRELVAWHPQLGVAGTRVEENRPQIKSAELSLHAPAGHTVRVIDTAGNAVGGVEVAVSVRMKESGWIISRSIKASHVRAGVDGVAIFSWVPRDGVLGLDVDLIGSDWKIDEIDRDHLAEGHTTLHVRKKVTVEGRLVMPDGASAAGVLIRGFGFGPKGRGDVPFARARHDGTFTLPIASDHGYALGIFDLQWASSPWTGIILKSDGAEAADVEIKVYRATPVNIRVTRGTDRQPVVGAWVDVGSRANFQFVDAKGKQRNASAGVGGWLRTDATGVATAGVGQGAQEIRLSDGTWGEERTLKVTSAEPLDVDFHRNWSGNRRLAGRLTVDGQEYTPSPALVAYAWTERSPSMPLAWQPEVKPDGQFEVSFDAENMAVLVIDREREKSAYASVGSNDSTAQLDMQTTARYSGTLLDEKGVPMGGRVIRLHADKAHDVAVGMQPTDDKGQFQFAGVAVGVPLSLSIESDEPSAWYSLSSRQRLFQPGEVRENDVVKAQLHRKRDSADAPKLIIPLTEMVAGVCRNARVARMRGLAVLEGDDSGNVNRLADNLLGSEDSREILNFVAMRVSAEQLKSEVRALADLGWQLPAAKEVVLVVLDGEQKPIASERLTADSGDAALDRGRSFLKEHKLPTRDAVALVKAARAEAQATGRRVWLVEGGPRCGPCFRLAGWMDDHHAALEKDYVLVKVMAGLDDNADAVLAELPRKKSGIPWHAITEPDGTVLVTSEGPLGNIGMPSSIEGVRHLRQMLDRTVRKLSADELDRLTKPMIKSD